MFPRAVFYFFALLVFAVIGFWIPWYSNMFSGHSIWVNFHAVVMSLWLLLLIVQAVLMRAGWRAVHRKSGKISFVLGPLCIVSIPLLAVSFFPPDGMEMSVFRSYILWLQVGLGILFSWFFIAAIYYRKKPALHARYMIATSLALIDPIVARFVIFYGPDAGTPPDMTVAPLGMQYISYPVLTIILLTLLYFDRDAKQGREVFRFAFAGFVIFEILTFTLRTTNRHLSTYESICQ